MMFVYLTLVLATAGYAAAKIEPVEDALQCGGCVADRCAAIGACHNGITWDVCGCCEVCAKGENDECGGPWNAYGKCGYGLTCLKDGRECPYIFNSRGTGADTGSNICDEYLFNELASRSEFLVGARPFSAGLLEGSGRDYLRSAQVVRWAIGRCVATGSIMNKGAFKRQMVRSQQHEQSAGLGYMLGDQPAKPQAPRTDDAQSLMGKRLMLKGVLRGVEY